MAIISNTYIRSKKPEGVGQVDWNNPLSDGLVFGHLSGNRVPDLIRGISPTYSGETFSAGEHGKHVSFAATGKANFGSSYQPISNTDKYSIVALAKPTSVATRSHFYMHGTETGAFPQYTFSANTERAGGNSAGRIALLEYDGGWKVQSESNTTAIDGNWHIFTATRDGSTVKLYRDGTDVTDFTEVTGTHVANQSIYIGGSDAIDRGGNYPIALVLVYNRGLSQPEIEKISQNPWQILKPRRRLYVIQGGAGTTVSPDNATHGHIADNATLSQNHILILSDAGHGHIAEQTILTQSHLLEIADSLHNHAADTATLSQNHILVLDSSNHGHGADQAALTQSHLLAIADSFHSQSADNATLGQAHILATDNASHAHAADPLVLDQTHILAVADALHAHAADNVSLTVAGALDIANSIHAHSADQIALTQLHILATANALHGHSADNVTLISGLTLDITDAIHGHAAGQVTLQQAHILTVINASHGHTAEQATLGVDLIIQPSSHAHTADIVSLDPVLALAIQDAIHAHQANNIALNQQHILVISDALHNHIAQNATISEGAFTISTFPARTITVVGKSRTITVVAGNRTINA